MNNANKVSSKYKLAYSLLFLFFILTVQSKNKVDSSFSFHNFLTASQDTIIPGKKILSPQVIQKLNRDTIPARDSLSARNKNSFRDTTITVETRDTLDLKISKDSLDAPVVYNADDSMILDVNTKKNYFVWQENIYNIQG